MALVIHAVLSIGFGLLFALVLPRLRPIPGPMAWGGLVLPLLWTGISYGLMGVVNPVLQERVDWPWFIVSQFVFGVAAAIVVVRSEMIHIPPAGPARTGWRTSWPAKGEAVVNETAGERADRRLSDLSWSLLAAGCDLPGQPRPRTGRCRRTRCWTSASCTAELRRLSRGRRQARARRRR